MVYTPEKSGAYEIRVFCGNIPLNGGHPFAMEVKPGMVTTLLWFDRWSTIALVSLKGDNNPSISLFFFSEL